jgi:hypothetical protein
VNHRLTKRFPAITNRKGQSAQWLIPIEGGFDRVQVDIGAATLSPKVSAQAAPKLLDIRTKEFGIRNAANIVLAENGRLELF